MPPPLEDDHLSSSNFAIYIPPYPGSHTSLPDPIDYDNDVPSSSGSSIPNTPAAPTTNHLQFKHSHHIPLTNLSALAALPVLRPIPLRGEAEIKAQDVHAEPLSNRRGGCLLSMRGDVREYECRLCRAGHGNFNLCVALDGWYGGSCANCVFGKKGPSCSLRAVGEREDVNVHQEVALLEPKNEEEEVELLSPSEDDGAQEDLEYHEQQPPSKRRRTSPVHEYVSAYVDGANEDATPIIRPDTHPTMTSMRNPNPHTSFPSTISTMIPQTYSAPYTSPYTSTFPTTQPSTDATTIPATVPSTSASTLPSTSTSSNPRKRTSASTNMESNKIQCVDTNGFRRNLGSAASQSTPPQSRSQQISTINTNADYINNGYHLTEVQYTQPRATFQGWPPQFLPNQAIASPGPEQPLQLPSSSKGLVRTDKGSLIDLVQQKQYPPNGTKRHQILHQSEHATEYESRSRSGSIAGAYKSPYGGPVGGYTSLGATGTTTSGSVGGAVMTNGNTKCKEKDMSFIDGLSKRKQREIFAIIGGIQGGLRLVRQQADSLQKQLDALQVALGIDDDEEQNVN